MALIVTALDRNAHSFANCLGNLPTFRIPFTTDLDIREELWAVPVKDTGVFRGYSFVATGGDQPTPDSFKVVKVTDRLTGDYYILVTTIAALTAAADGATLAPGTIPTPIPDANVCVSTSGVNSGSYEFLWAAPAKAAGDEYQAHVLVDNVQAVPPAAAGHATIAAMITWLNANYAAAGTWSNPSGLQVKLVAATDLKVGLAITVANLA